MIALNRKRLHLIAGTVTGLLLVLLGVLLALSCVDIYRSGTSPFTYESIGAHFKRILPAVIAALVALLVDAALWLLLPPEREKLRVTGNDAPALSRLREKKGRTAASVKEEKLRYLLRGAGLLVCVIALILPLPSLLDNDRYTMETLEGNAVIIDSVLRILLPVAVMITVIITVSILAGASVKRELAALREGSETVGAPALTVRIDAVRGFFGKNEKKLLLVARIALPVLAVALIIFGALNGGMADVLQKAIRICTECIGLG